YRCSRSAQTIGRETGRFPTIARHMATQSKGSNPLRGWQVDRASIRTIGHDLQRPECILAEPDGTLWSADARGGVMRIAPDGTQELVAQHVDSRFAQGGADPNKYMLQG